MLRSASKLSRHAARGRRVDVDVMALIDGEIGNLPRFMSTSLDLKSVLGEKVPQEQVGLHYSTQKGPSIICHRADLCCYCLTL